MHHLLFSLMLFFLSPTFWHDIAAQTSVRVIAIAGVVSVLTQSIKRIFPGLQGKYAIALNAAVSLAGVFVGMNPANFWSETTLMQVLPIFAAAAGFHSFAKTIGPADDSKAADKRSINGNGLAPAFALVLFCGVLAGCASKTVTAAAPPPLPAGAIDQFDANANKTLEPIHAFAARVTADFLAGKVFLTQPQRVALDRLNAGLNAADAAEVAYHNGGGGSPSQLSAAVAAVSASFTQAQQMLAVTARP